MRGEGQEWAHRRFRLARFLTGDESPVLMDAHAEAGFQVGRPFAAEGAYDFGAERDMTRRVAGLGKVMLKHRLTPPPREAYSCTESYRARFWRA